MKGSTERCLLLGRKHSLQVFGAVIPFVKLQKGQLNNS